MASSRPSRRSADKPRTNPNPYRDTAEYEPKEIKGKQRKKGESIATSADHPLALGGHAGANSLTPKSKLPKKATPKTEGQKRLLDTIDLNRITWVLGVPGSGKSHLSVGKAVEKLEAGVIEKIVLVRPNIGVGRTSGYLPGDLTSKMAGFLRPLLDELKHFYDAAELKKLLRDGVIEIVSLEYARGLTFLKSAVLLDEAQNATDPELNMFLNRLGEGSFYVINGDVSRDVETGRMKQCDLHVSEQGALEKYSGMFLKIPGIARVILQKCDCVRDPLVRAMQEAGL